MEKALFFLKKYKLIFITSLFFLIFSQLNFTNTEFTVYESYNRSIVYDLDLNIKNQFFFEDDKKIVTPNGYFYTHHNYGSALLQTPFFVYASQLGKINNLERTFPLSIKERPEKTGIGLKGFHFRPGTQEDFEQESASVANIFIFLLAFFLFIKEFTGRYKIENPFNFKLANILLLLSGPALHYLLYAQSTPNLTTLLPLFLIFYFSRRLDSYENNLLLGISFGLGFSIRHDFAVYGIFILLWWTIYKPGIKKALMQAVGLFSIVIPALIFEYNKLGHLHFGYLDTFYFNLSTLSDMLFSSYGGIFFVHPAFLIVISIAIYGIYFSKDRTQNKTLELAAAFLIIFIKTALLGLTFSHNGGVLGGRQVIQDYLLISLFASMLLCGQKKNVLWIIPFALWNFVLGLVYKSAHITKVNFFQVDDTYFSFFKRTFEGITEVFTFNNVIHIYSILNIIVNYSLLLFFIIFIIYKLKYRLRYLLYIVVVLNLTIISLDYKRGKDKVSTHDIETDSMNVLMYYENMGSILERLYYLSAQQRQNNSETVRYLKLAKEYQETSLKDINKQDINLFDYFKHHGDAQFTLYLNTFLKDDK
tara:strand:+ start:200202 stop:201968 length:1767 start_codon:yes stop_codon:yes gene_type:complete